jgi:hypothetical protein
MHQRLSAFQAKARTAETYLAGIGASGALIASAFVLFIVLVGAVTFNAWPHAGQLFNGSDGNVSLQNVPRVNQAPPQPAPTPNLVALLGGPAPATAIPVSNPGGGGNGNGGGNGGGGNIGGGNPGGSLGSHEPGVGGGGGNGGGGGGGTTTVAPAPPGQRTTNTLGQVVAGVGNNVESDTNTLGEQLGGPDTTLGGLVQGLGSTLNNTLQQLGGTR